MNVCIVIPIYKERNQLSRYEEISLKQCFKVLRKYTIFYVGPDHLNWDEYLQLATINDCKATTKFFPDKYFLDLAGYSRLLLDPNFYKAFASFDHLLIHQSDAFVFHDDLEYWCNQQYDYIGAPWFDSFSSSDDTAPFILGGNGGFSLRNIQAHLKVLHSFSYISQPAENWKKRIGEKLSVSGYIREACGFLLDLTVRNNTFWMLNSFKGFEDQFWCLVAARNFSWFRIPDYKEAMNFAIEMQPRRVFDVNNQRLPLGCHAWWKYDLDFWKPYISKYGYQL